MGEQITLPPCPFCEGPPKPVVAKADYLGGGVFDESKIPRDGVDAEALVFCHECGATGEIVEELVFTEEDCRRIERQAVLNWCNRDNRHRRLYDGSAADGLNLYPRQEEL